METGEIAFLVLVVAAFTAFAVSLAVATHRTS
jgi:hypothetical protein